MNQDPKFNLEEVVQLRLQELYSLPILTYCIAAFDLKVKQLAELNAVSYTHLTLPTNREV